MKKTTSSSLPGPELQAAYRRLADLLCDERILSCPLAGFSLLCRRAGAPRRALDALLRSELGMGGRRLLREMRRAQMDKNAQSGGTFLAIKR